MKALIHTDAFEFEYCDVPPPDHQEDQLLIRIGAVGICGSDIHGFTGATGRRIPPVIMGHETAGKVIKAPSNSKFNPGDRVALDSTIYCGNCVFCDQGRINLCEHRTVIGVSCGEYRKDGAMAEFIAVPERILHNIPDSLSMENACMIEPATVALHATSLARIDQDSTVMVVGAGVIGLFIVQAVRLAGAKTIIAVDIDDGRLEIARHHGATETHNPLTTPTGETSLPTIDVGIEAVGKSETINLLLNNIRKGGQLVLVGNVSPTVELPLQKIVSSEISIVGSCASAGEYPEAIELLSTGSLKTDKIIGQVAPLSEGGDWFKKLYHKEVDHLKVILKP